MEKNEKKLTPLSQEEVERLRRLVKDGKVVFAETTTAQKHRAKLDELIRHMGVICHMNWTIKNCFVSDESKVGDFLREVKDLEMLSARLGFGVAFRDRLVDIAMRMGKPA